MSEKRKYRLVYFKAWSGPRGVGGKYYSGGEYESGSPWGGVLEEVEALQRDRRLPGLSAGHSPYHVLVDDGEATHLLLSEYVGRDVDKNGGEDEDLPEEDSVTIALPTLEDEEPLTDVEQRLLVEQVKAAVEQTLLRVYQMRQQKKRRDSIKVSFSARKGGGG